MRETENTEMQGRRRGRTQEKKIKEYIVADYTSLFGYRIV
jgi:hypothetical protein